MAGTDAKETFPVRIPLLRNPAGVLKSWQMMRENVLNIIPQSATREPVLSGHTGNRWHMIMDPPSLQRMLLERVEDYPKSTVTKNLLRPAIGESLFITEGAHWRWQRRACAPVFSHRDISALSQIMTAATNHTADRIADAGPRAVNMLDEMIAATFDVIAEVTFSDDGSFDRSAVHRAIDSYVSDAGYRQKPAGKYKTSCRAARHRLKTCQICLLSARSSTKRCGCIHLLASCRERRKEQIRCMAQTSGPATRS